MPLPVPSQRSSPFSVPSPLPVPLPKRVAVAITPQRRELMRYRSVATGEVIIISSGDFARLVSREYLNDILIDYDLARTFDRCLGQTYWQRVVRCNCFFWPRLEKYLNGAAEAVSKGAAVRIRPAQKPLSVDPFGKDMLLIPVNEM